MSSQTSGIDPVGVARPADLDGSVFEEKPQPMSDEGDHQPPAKATNTVTKTVTRPGDRIFSGLAKGSGVFVVALIGLVAVFLILRAVPALSNDDENNLFTGGIVLAVMILPIIAAVTREVFIQTPKGQIEAALALGATKWEVVRTTIIPFGTSGYISGSMLGLGRALGETIALMLILSGTSVAFGWSLFDSGSTFATHIASNASEFNNELEAGAYIAAGLVLFVLTFLVNSAARAVVGGKGRA
ncbi:PstC family ABC transporter permease [Mycobacteroides chelonae]|uniref:PstC family ABC transporter permease n=1 Tax=Mycobacteroides chelonae TaxID=1774 RepID=UPI000E23CE45|nr:ABC transporter permease subunit [Mycobacteroides chelonae]AYM40830.1 ABC transporter permease subunit [[Mycobacterium] chelonae subsp. gwanakae]